MELDVEGSIISYDMNSFKACIDGMEIKTFRDSLKNLLLNKYFLTL